VVADQLGHKVINAVGKSAGTVNTASGLTMNWESGVDATLTVAGFIPAVSDVAAPNSIVWDIAKTVRKVGQCQNYPRKSRQGNGFRSSQ
jgi:hypothetical protein